MIKSNKLRTASYLILGLVLGLVFLVGLSFGFLKIEMSQVIQTLLGYGSQANNFTILTLRMPRLLMTLLMGMALALSGSVLQTLSRNDLADPGILGINAGAGLGVTIAYLMMDFTSASVVYVLPLAGFLGALTTFGLTVVLSTDKKGNLNVDKLILAGIGSAIALSGLMILFIASAGREDVQFIYRWLSGNIWGDKWSFVQVTIPLVGLLAVLILRKMNTMNILGLDDISAQSLGVDLKKERLYLVVCAVALAAVVVSVGGAISFVGLIVPHMAKKVYGPRHQYFLLGSMLFGGLFLMGADLIGRNILQPGGLLPGIMVSLIGAPYFLYLVFKTSH